MIFRRMTDSRLKAIREKLPEFYDPRGYLNELIGEVDRAREAEEIDPRPRCIQCAHRWTPSEGVDATVVTCARCQAHGNMEKNMASLRGTVDSLTRQRDQLLSENKSLRERPPSPRAERNICGGCGEPITYPHSGCGDREHGP